MPQKNLAVELLQKVLAGEIKTRFRKNVVIARSFAEMLQVAQYQSRAIQTAQVIEELIALAKEMNAAGARGEKLGLTSACAPPPAWRRPCAWRRTRKYPSRRKTGKNSTTGSGPAGNRGPKRSKT